MLRGSLSIARVPRLAETYELLGPVDVDLAFKPEGDNRVWVSGKLGMRANVQCQRCLESFPDSIAVAVDVGFGVPLEDDAREVLAGLDDEFDLAALVEDELLLGAPMVHKHPAGQCGNELTGADIAPSEPEPPRTRRPFAELGNLLVAHESKPKTGD